MLKDYFRKILKKFTFSKGEDSSKGMFKPYRDWKILVIVFFVALIISIGLNTYLSVQIIDNNFLTASIPTNSGPVLDRDGLTKVLSDFAAREAFLANPNATTSPVVDPSR